MQGRGTPGPGKCFPKMVLLGFWCTYEIYIQNVKDYTTLYTAPKRFLQMVLDGFIVQLRVLSFQKKVLPETLSNSETLLLSST